MVLTDSTESVVPKIKKEELNAIRKRRQKNIERATPKRIVNFENETEFINQSEITTSYNNETNQLVQYEQFIISRSFLNQFISEKDGGVVINNIRVRQGEVRQYLTDVLLAKYVCDNNRLLKIIDNTLIYYDDTEIIDINDFTIKNAKFKVEQPISQEDTVQFINPTAPVSEEDNTEDVVQVNSHAHFNNEN